MKKAFTVYIDDDCEMEGFLAAFAIHKTDDPKMKSVTFQNKEPAGPMGLYIPFTDRRKDRGNPIYFDDEGGVPANAEEVLNHD